MDLEEFIVNHLKLAAVIVILALIFTFAGGVGVGHLVWSEPPGSPRNLLIVQTVVTTTAAPLNETVDIEERIRLENASYTLTYKVKKCEEEEEYEFEYEAEINYTRKPELEVIINGKSFFSGSLEPVEDILHVHVYYEPEFRGWVLTLP